MRRREHVNAIRRLAEARSFFRRKMKGLRRCRLSTKGRLVKLEQAVSGVIEHMLVDVLAAK